MTYVIVRKIAASRCPDVPAAPPGPLDRPAVSPLHSLPIDYEMEGYLFEPLRIGGIIRLHRIRRNQVIASGKFESSPIVALRDPFVETRNSIYHIARKAVK